MEAEKFDTKFDNSEDITEFLDLSQARHPILDYTIISGNIFQDLEFANAEEKLAKVKLASVIADILEQQEITRQQATQILDLEIEKLNNLTKGMLKEFTIENLLSYLIKLGQKVEIMVTNQQPDKSQPKINVVYQKIA